MWNGNHDPADVMPCNQAGPARTLRGKVGRWLLFGWKRSCYGIAWFHLSLGELVIRWFFFFGARAMTDWEILANSDFMLDIVSPFFGQATIVGFYSLSLV